MDKLNQWLTLVANIGVIVGIAFLAIEIQQNTAMIQSQTRDSITEKQIAVFEWFATSTENNRIRKEGDSLELDFESPEGHQYFWMIAGNLRLWENEWYQYQQGLFEPEEFEPRLKIWRRMVNTPGIIFVWQEGQKDAFSPEFAALIDSFIEDSRGK